MTTGTGLRSLAPLLAKEMKRCAVPGVAVGIRLEGKTHTYGFGETNIEFPLPVDADTLFMIGSVTKTYTGTVMAMLAEEGLVDLDALVTDYLPRFRAADADVAANVRVIHLLTHMSGWLGDYFADFGRGADALDKMVRGLKKAAPQLTALGTVWAYNNAGFYVAGRIIEKVTGKAFEDVVRERIFEPLAMDRSFFFAEDVFTHKAALGHHKVRDGLKISRPWGLSRSSNAAGGVVSTVVDQLRFAAFHLGDGRAADGTRVLSRAALRGMHKPRESAGSIGDRMALTWFVDDHTGTRVLKHGGTVNGQTAHLVLVPSRDFALIVLCNALHGHELDQIVTRWAFDKLLDLPVPGPSPATLATKVVEAYVGSYRQGQTELQVSLEDGSLVFTVVYDDALHEADPDLIARVPPPRRMVLTGRDRGVLDATSSTGARFEFVRGDDREVAWLRWGGRIYRRV